MIDVNKIASEIAKEIIKEENSYRRKVVVYSDRFQPFHSGHYNIYERLVEEFGKDSVYVGLSDKDAPFTIDETTHILNNTFGIPSEKVVQLDDLKEVLSEDCALVSVVSESYDLDDSVFKEYNDDKPLDSFDKGAYLYIIPENVSNVDERMGDPSVSKSEKKKLFKELYNKFDEETFNIVSEKLTKETVMNYIVERKGKLFEIPKADVQKVDNYADKQLNPIDIDLSGGHFFDRLNDPRNKKDISMAELIGFFKRLRKNKKDFIEFLDRYKQIVVTDNRSNINIPFMKKANRAIAKTIMRKPNFKTSNVKLTVETAFPLDVGYTFRALKDIGGLKKGVKYVVDDIKGSIGNMVVTVTDGSKKIPIKVRSKPEFYKKVMDESRRDRIKGGLADDAVLSDLAIMHGVSMREIEKEFKMGVKVEMEHTRNKEIAKEIALDHLYENPRYYTRLKKVEQVSADLYLENTEYSGILENKFLRKGVETHFSSEMNLINENEIPSIDVYLKETKELFSEMVFQQTLSILAESGGLPGVVDVPSSMADKVVKDFADRVLKPLGVVDIDSIVGLGSTRQILQKLPNAKKASGDLDLLAVAKGNNRAAVGKIADVAKQKDWDYQIAFGNIISIAYPYGGDKYQVDLMIAKPSEGDAIYDYMRKFKYFSDEDPNQSGDFILKGAHRSELAKTIVKAMGLSASNTGFKEFIWNEKFKNMKELTDKLENKASRSRKKEKKEQLNQIVDLLKNKVKTLDKLKKAMAGDDELLNSRYPNALFKSYPEAYSILIDMLFSKEATADRWEDVLDRKFKITNTIERMNKFDDVMDLIEKLLKKRLITPRSVVGVFKEMKNNFDTGKAAAKWNRSLEEYIEQKFPFLKGRW